MSLKKLVIHEDVVIHKYKYSLEEVFACLLVSECKHPEDLLNDLVNKGKLYTHINEETGETSFYLMHNTLRELQSILLDSKKELPNSEELEGLYLQLKEIYPKGKKQGTNSYWCGNKKDTIRKLQMFLDEYGLYTQEQIIKATKHYVNSFNGNTTTMRILPYFIGKFGESDLATTLENMDDDNSEFINQDHGDII